MPKSRVSKKRMFRDFSFLKEVYVSNNGLKNLHSVRKEFCESSGVSFSHLEFLLWCYDLEFFTISYASEEYGMNHDNLANRVIYPLVRQGLLYKHFDKLTPSQELPVAVRIQGAKPVEVFCRDVERGGQVGHFSLRLRPFYCVDGLLAQYVAGYRGRTPESGAAPTRSRVGEDAQPEKPRKLLLRDRRSVPSSPVEDRGRHRERADMEDEG